MQIVWDDDKNRRNKAKHRVSFEFASFVFEDQCHISQLDPCDTEERWRTLGLVKGVILHVVHTIKEEENGKEEIRIISARKATRLERRAYEDRY
jgi:uncharacterized DUF497 family protein